MITFRAFLKILTETIFTYYARLNFLIQVSFSRNYFHKNYIKYDNNEDSHYCRLLLLIVIVTLSIIFVWVEFITPDQVHSSPFITNDFTANEALTSSYSKYIHRCFHMLKRCYDEGILFTKRVVSSMTAYYTMKSNGYL